LLVITDAMINRVTQNWQQGKRTHLFIDEFHVLFENEHSGEFFNSAWRRFRKRNALASSTPCSSSFQQNSMKSRPVICQAPEGKKIKIFSPPEA